MHRAGSPGGIEILSFLPPCAKERIILSNRESVFLSLRRSRGDAPRSSAGKTEELRLFGTFRLSRRKAGIKGAWGAAKDRMEKGRAGDPGIADRKALKASERYQLQKAAVDSEKRIRYL